MYKKLFIIAAIIFAFASACVQNATHWDCVHTCLAPSLSGNDRLGTYTEGKDEGVAYGSLKIDPAKPTILFVLELLPDPISYLGPYGEMADLFWHTKRELGDRFNVINLTLQKEITPEIRSVYENFYRGEGIITQDFLFSHRAEINLMKTVIYKDTFEKKEPQKKFENHFVEVFGQNTIVRQFYYSGSEETARHKAKPGNLLPSLDGKWILPSQLESAARELAELMRTHDLDTLKKDYAETILTGNYAQTISRLSAEQLVGRTMNLSYCVNVTTLKNYLFLLTRMLNETDTFPQGICIFLPLRKNNLDPDGIPTQEWIHKAITPINRSIRNLSEDEDNTALPRVLFPNPEGEGYIYYYNTGPISTVQRPDGELVSSYNYSSKTVIPENDITQKDIIVIPTGALENRQFLKGIALSFLEHNAVVPPLMTGNGSSVAAYACSVMFGCPNRVIHDGTIGQLDIRKLSSFVFNLIPKEFRTFHEILLYSRIQELSRLKDIDTLAWLFEPGSGRVEMNDYLRFVEQKDIAHEFSIGILIEQSA